MNLTSLRRARLYCAGDSNDPQSDTLKNNRVLAMWLPGVSAEIESYLRRTIALDQYTQYFDTVGSKPEFFLPAFPVLSMQDFFEDPLGQWIGNERQIQYVFPGMTFHSVLSLYVMNYPGRKNMRARYYGGLARHAVNSRYSLTAGTGTFAINSSLYVIGQTSGAVGFVQSIGTDIQGSYITIEVYYGSFQAGETIVQNTAEDGSGTTSADGILSIYPEYGFYRITGNETYAVGQYVKGQTSGNIQQILEVSGTPIATVTLDGNGILDNEACNVYGSNPANATATELFQNQFRIMENRGLIEVAPEIVTGCEMQLRYARQRGLDFENAGTNKDGVTRRDNSKDRSFLLPEVKNMINCWKTYVNY
jgi:hypothetical protein